MKQVISISTQTKFGGGEWLQDSKGLVTIGANIEGDSALSETGLLSVAPGQQVGEATHTLTMAELPRHRFGVGSHGDRGASDNLAMAGNSIGAEFLGTYTYSQWFTEYLGENKSHNNTQPSLGVIRWHRIA